MTKKSLLYNLLVEMTTTANIAGYDSKFAFKGENDKRKDKFLGKINKLYGWEVVDRKKLRKNTKTIDVIDLWEDITVSDIAKIRELVRLEVSNLFYTLFKKRKMWI